MAIDGYYGDIQEQEFIVEILDEDIFKDSIYHNTTNIITKAVWIPTWSRSLYNKSMLCNGSRFFSKHGIAEGALSSNIRLVLSPLNLLRKIT
ncbi:hypothetical protein N9K77_01340 [bacterium]|nr:hypothetical protein [bacterium]